MKIILKKVRKKTWFSYLEPIKCEPLELEYIKATIDDICHVEIVDPLFGDRMSEADIILLNGYNTARVQVIKEAREYKKKYKNPIIIVSGIDVQLNGDLYRSEWFDYVYEGSSLTEFRELIQKIVGINVSQKDNREDEIICPDRSFFLDRMDETFYLNYKGVALVKNSIGCPYKCKFCYCKNLNDGKYIKGSYDEMLLEMSHIDANYYWVVDDVFVNSVEDIVDFHRVSKAYQQTFSIICYMRSDTVLKCADYLHLLKEAGVVEIIIGFESVKGSRLDGYEKGYDPSTNTQVARILREKEMAFTALFMVHPDDQISDFKALIEFIKHEQIAMYTFSIFTPFRGTDIYEDYKGRIIDDNPAHYDFLHLVIKPNNMSSFRFQWAFIKLHIFQFFHSKRSRKIVMRRLFKVSKENYEQ